MKEILFQIEASHLRESELQALLEIRQIRIAYLEALVKRLNQSLNRKKANVSYFNKRCEAFSAAI